MTYNDIISMDKKKIEYNKVLKSWFGYESLKPEQFQIIYEIVEKKTDVTAILSTGFGKSITFQMPYLLTSKSVIVVSPLIALIKDQKEQLEKLNIPVCGLDSTCKNKNYEKALILEGESKIIYITPEYLIKCEDFVKDLAQTHGIACIAIDESHSVSCWGHSFRPDYKKLGIIREWIPTVPMLTVTATATKIVRDDIIKILGQVKPVIVTGSFDRPNLFISVACKTNDIKADLGDLLTKFKNEYILIYCKTRDDTEKIAEKINKIGYKCLAYHAGQDDKTRAQTQEDFTLGKIKILVPTIAFGLGINIPNIRLVVHYGCPKDIESYYQEVGRAGRDGNPSYVCMFYTNKDFVLNRMFLKSIQDAKHRNYQEAQIKNIEKYVYTTTCRRRVLIQHFDDKYTKERCDNCDNCKKQADNAVDFTLPSYLLLSTINSMDGKYGTGIYIGVLRGSNAKNIYSSLRRSTFYGKGKSYTENFLKCLIRMLINKEYLRSKVMKGSFGATIECTRTGREWINLFSLKYKNVLYDNNIVIKDDDKLMLDMTQEMKQIYVKKNPVSILEKNTDFDNMDDEDRKLFFELADIDDNKVIEEKENNAITITTKTIVTKPNNHSKKWDNDEEQLLLSNSNKLSIKELAELHNRTTGAILSRLKMIAVKMHNEGKTVENIIKTTGLKKHQIEHELEKLNLL